MPIHTLAVLVAAVLATLPPGAVPAPAQGGARHHIRTTEPDLRRLLEDGVRRSPTFRAIVDRLAGSDVIVYLRSESYWPVPADGRMTFATAAGGFRYVIVRLRRQRSRPHLLALLAHELRHAVEVADTPAIVDGASLAREYERLGHARKWVTDTMVAFDTQAAVDAGYQVLMELRTTPRRVDHHAAISDVRNPGP